MAQIKNIKKPGDLIRGASVGLAGLDKDGNVIGYKAAAADAGKVLTVGEDGSVAPAEGGGDELYRHDIKYQNTSSPFLSFSFSIINDSPTPFTKESLKDYIKNNYYRSTNPTTDRFLACCGTYRSSSSSDIFLFNGIEQHPTVDDIIIRGGAINISNGSLTFSNGEALIAWSSFSTINDTVIPV